MAPRDPRASRDRSGCRLDAAAQFLAVVATCASCASAPATAPGAPPAATVTVVVPAARPEAAPSAGEGRAAAQGEIATPVAVTFAVRPLGGPGTMGPLEIAESSEPALDHVRAHLEAHPEITKLRVECRVDGLRTSSMPDARYAVELARQVTRRLVGRGVACSRLVAVGSVVMVGEAPVERVRFVVGGPPASGEIAVDACEPR